MTPQEFLDKIREEGLVRYKGKSRPGMTGDFPSDPSWPYIHAKSFVQAINSGMKTYEEVRDALWKQLDRFEGDAYGAFIMCEHDSGACVVNYLRTGDAAHLVAPRPADLRFAPASDVTQVSFLEQGLDLYGNPMVAFHRDEGAKSWAQFASRPPYNAYDVFPETARWLLLNNLMPYTNDRNWWGKYARKTIAECVVIIEEVNHPGVVYPGG